MASSPTPGRKNKRYPQTRRPVRLRRIFSPWDFGYADVPGYFRPSWPVRPSRPVGSARRSRRIVPCPRGGAGGRAAIAEARRLGARVQPRGEYQNTPVSPKNQETHAESNRKPKVHVLLGRPFRSFTVIRNEISLPKIRSSSFGGVRPQARQTPRRPARPVCPPAPPPDPLPTLGKISGLETVRSVPKLGRRRSRRIQCSVL